MREIYIYIFFFDDRLSISYKGNVLNKFILSKLWLVDRLEQED